jgi:hypothetical protein
VLLIGRPAAKNPPPLFILEFQIVYCIFLAFAMGICFKAPLDSSIRSSINVDRPIKNSATCLPLAKSQRHKNGMDQCVLDTWQSRGRFGSDRLVDGKPQGLPRGMWSRLHDWRRPISD